MRIGTFDRASNSLFWSIFTSKEYLSFVPFLIHLKHKPELIIDGGAALGYFSLLIEHLNRVGILDWPDRVYHLIEPSPVNFRRLKFNIRGNLLNSKIYNNLIGPVDKQVVFYYNPLMPWSGSAIKRKGLSSSRLINSLDLKGLLNDGKPIFIKLDIEGAEFDFFKNYFNSLKNVTAILVEWHTEFGNHNEFSELLVKREFQLVHQYIQSKNRIIQLFIKN